MRPLRLDYVRRPPCCETGEAAWLAAAALLFVAVAAYAGWLHILIGSMETAGVRPASAAAADNARYVSYAREAQTTADRLAREWDGLFRAIEAATQGAQVALLAIQPDADTRLVRIQAEAKSLVDALGLVDALAADGKLLAVHLTHHETLNEPARPVRFSITATWRSRS